MSEQRAEWLDILLQQRQQRKDAQAYQMAHEELAKSQASAMLGRLSARVQADISAYATGGGAEGVRFESRTDVFEVKRDRFPTIFLQVQLDRSAAIFRVVRTYRASAGAETSRHESTIFIVALGPDDLYYRLGGRDYADEADVSSQLLSGLLKFLEDPFSPGNYPVIFQG